MYFSFLIRYRRLPSNVSAKIIGTQSLIDVDLISVDVLGVRGGLKVPLLALGLPAGPTGPAARDRAVDHD